MRLDSIRHIVFTPDLMNTDFIEHAMKIGINCIPIMDARSAVYTAIGACEQNQETVIVCVSSSNASRSAFSGMTEAFYRNLPVVLITFGCNLDYTKELNDVVYAHYVVCRESEIEPLLCNKLPIHIELKNENTENSKIRCSKTQEILETVLEEKEYLYIGQGIAREGYRYRCKVVEGGMPNCSDGAIANLLGASLAQIRKRYVGLIAEEEFIHDLNTLGNRNVNDRLFIIVIAKKLNAVIEHYAKSFEFLVYSEYEDNISSQNFRELINNGKKTILVIYQEN